MDTQIRPGCRPFYDDINFSRGLARSGFFNKREVDTLHRYGATLQALVAGTLLPINDDEVDFIKALQQPLANLHAMAGLWRKYQAAVSSTRRAYTVSTGGKRIELSYRYEVETV
ncbi:hypothetical protein E2K93_07690 [Thalassotalea sp. HSM 43]|uniref:DUF413 domain-containing protein n=1 Tax=Thalassotalea sp. HSM 43 TaxID=2552945 RepID=UPI00108051C9|nr:DUF413 domain-containing protein [Thalassotalea sp. HSM 43]QBY04277.1 hypothetical protein E2K93_07690 [Thalassotalea sp. HSM 43]